MTKTAARPSSDVSKLLKEARTMVKGFNASRRAAGNHLKQDLARGRTQTKTDVKQMLTEFRQARKNGGAETIKKQQRPAAMSRSVNGARTRRAPGKTNTIDFREKLLEAINAHPEGITLAAIADGLGVAPVVLSKTMAALVVGRKVRRENLNYFPTAG